MFAKVFQQILDSSLANDWEVRHVFEDMLKLATPDGIVDITRESISRRTNVPLEIVTRGIAELEKPDNTSRTPDAEGRRIVRLDPHRDWGWRIVNFLKYRESATQEMLRMSEAHRKREYRHRKRFPHTPSQSTDTDKEEEREQSIDMSGTKRATSCKATLEEIQLFCAKSGIQDSDAVWFFHKCEGNGWTNGGKPIKRWTATLLSWKAAGYLASQKQTTQTNGKYPTKPNAAYLATADQNPRNLNTCKGVTDYAAHARIVANRKIATGTQAGVDSQSHTPKSSPPTAS